MIKNTDIYDIILILLITGVIVWVVHQQYYEKEPFIVLIDDNAVPYGCPEYLYTDGKKYYAHDSRKMIDGINNPKQFNTLDEAMKYIKNLKCPENIPVNNLVVNKTGKDPTTNYEQKCSRIIAEPNYFIEKCMHNSKDLSKIREYQDIIDKPENKKYYDLETCVSDLIEKETGIKNTNEFQSHKKLYEDGKILGFYPTI